ncbi:hypothetical protein M408DRAFT_6888 [Serendipita vermifera MAFF 305830]|uniref:Uncharacterized protein n=1 Tax=Serendipita vermifera MAFF 305830 TaxID=933852 RepID=A0A0C2XSD6_SERVB|nr:hypothetical protein M408DRAFT_6888 [Serendipita vermifera MAFF 305830]
MLSEPNPSQRSANLVPPRKRVISSIRITAPKVTTAKANGVQPSNPSPGYHSRTPSGSQVGIATKPRATVTARAIPPKTLSPPLAAQSPPTSTLSARSSASIISSSLSARIPGSLSTATDEESENDQDESFDDERAETPQAEPDEDSIFAEEAKSNRKILDLEISNQSLLTVNTMLEATKLRQTREIKELRRKLREMRHVPSRPLYTNSETHSPTTSDLSLPNNNRSNSSHSSDEEEEPEPDPAYDRIVHLIEGLLSQAHRALDRTIDDCMPAPTNTVKVLSAVEIQQYERRALGLEPNEEEEGDKGEDEKQSEADVSLDAHEIETETKEDEDAAYLGEDDSSKQRLSSLNSGRRKLSVLAGKPPD